MALPAAAKLLSAAHLMAQPRHLVSAMPSARKLGVKIAEAIGAALSDAGTAPWRVTLERLEDSASLAGEDFGMPVRVESRAGSMTLHLGLDRNAFQLGRALGGADRRGRAVTTFPQDGPA